MSKRKGRWDPPLPGPPSGTGPSITEMQSDDEKAGKPLPPHVQLILPIPPETVHPCLLAAPFDSAATLAQLQAGFASLTEDELRVARLWLMGATIRDASAHLRMKKPALRELWRSMRRKLRAALRPPA